MQMEKIMYHVIVNPTSGKGKGQKGLNKLEKMFGERGIEYVVHKTEHRDHAMGIARELSLVPDTKLIVLGGDGTFHEVLCGIENFDNITLGLVPCGSGNDFIKSSGHPKKVEKALEVILKGESSYIDFIQLDGMRCFNTCGGGIDVDVLLKFAKCKFLKGKVAYFYSLLYALAHTKFYGMRVTIDGETKDMRVFTIGVGNGGFLGGGLPLCPNAKVDDGLLQIGYVNEVKRWKIPAALMVFLRAKHVSTSWGGEVQGKEITIESLDGGFFQLDGEIQYVNKLSMKVVPNTLKVFR
jgi:YegS/Rv2252/BmrU family lipid kinase